MCVMEKNIEMLPESGDLYHEQCANVKMDYYCNNYYCGSSISDNGASSRYF